MHLDVILVVCVRKCSVILLFALCRQFYMSMKDNVLLKINYFLTSIPARIVTIIFNQIQFVLYIHDKDFW